MRTDAKIGFAIGAVLLAVLTVYAIVVPKKRTASPQGVKVVAQNVPTISKPSPDVTIVDKTPTPIGPDLVLPEHKVDAIIPANSTPAPGPVANNDQKPADTTGGVNWDKLVGPSSTLYSANPTNNTTPDTAAPAGSTTLTPPPADPSTFTPGEGSTTADVVARHKAAPIGNTSEGTARTTDHSKSAPTHKTTRSHSTEVASTAKPASAEKSSAGQYVIEAGDTLAAIAAEHYGASHYYVAILKANPSLNPNRMRPGTKISLPDLSSAIAARSSETTVADLQSPRTSIRVDAGGAAGGGVFTPGNSPDTLFATNSTSHGSSDTTYTVHAGDNLYRISKKLYGTSKMAHEIFATNQDVIGSDMSKLKLGMVLTLPETPLQ